MANINPEKLIQDLGVVPSIEGELRLNWRTPIDLQEDEEIIITRRKDAFPIEIRNRNFEDRYTDTAQVEVFRGKPIYCSHLIPNGLNTLELAGDNSFIPAMTELERDNKYVGRLIRDSKSQVFRVTGNNETQIFYESISTNEASIRLPIEGSYVILAEFISDRRLVQTLNLLPDSKTLTITDNVFIGGDTLVFNNTITLTYGIDWLAGATAFDTALNIKNAMFLAGVKYPVTVYDTTLLIEKGSETTLAVSSSNPNAEVIEYAAARGKIFIPNSILAKNELRHLLIQDGNAITRFVRSNSEKVIELYDSIVVPNFEVFTLDSFNNTFPSGFIDRYKSELEALTKRPTGLETDVFYYYTGFTIPITSTLVTYNENDVGGENPLPYTIDKLAPYYVRISYESIKYANINVGEYTSDPLTGTIQFSDSRDLSSEDIGVGYLFADSQGRRFSIVDVSNLASGSFKIGIGQSVGTNPTTALHGSITVADTPVGFTSIQVGDTFKDIAGNSFPIQGTNLDPLAGISIPPSHSFDIGQGLIDEVIALNPFLVPYSYDPEVGKIQYGERVITQNSQLSPFTYNSLDGIVTYTTNINLGEVEAGQYFVDGADTKFEILSVNPELLQITLNDGLTVDNTVDTRRNGSVIDIEGFTDVDGTSLINLSKATSLDLFKTNSKAVFVIDSVDSENGALFISPNLDSISLTIDSEFDGAILRRGSEVSWVGFENENIVLLSDSNLGSVRRYNSVNDSQFAYFSNSLSTQAFAISAKDNEISRLLYRWWPSIFRSLDETGDLEDLMSVFGYRFNELYSLITTYELQNSRLIVPQYLENASQQQGLSLVSESLGIDTRRRIMNDLISCWKSKGSREGIFKFIKILTTWDITNGTGDVNSAITDSSPETTGLRLYSTALGTLNTNIVDTTEIESPPAGRFVKGISGLNLSGFFDQVEIQIELPNVALYLGFSNNINYVGGNTLLNDTSADFGQINSLKGCYIIPSEENPNEYYEIISNTQNSVTVAGTVPISSLGTKYIVLSPLNLNRFIALQSNIEEQLPYNAIPVFNFTIKTI